MLSVHEKSQIQALDRTQPGLLMKKGTLGTVTHDYRRNGTTTLFAALNMLDGTVIDGGGCVRSDAAPDRQMCPCLEPQHALSRSTLALRQSFFTVEPTDPVDP